jgi:hypothetical protein
MRLTTEPTAPPVDQAVPVVHGGAAYVTDREHRPAPDFARAVLRQRVMAAQQSPPAGVAVLGSTGMSGGGACGGKPNPWPRRWGIAWPRSKPGVAWGPAKRPGDSPAAQARGPRGAADRPPPRAVVAGAPQASGHHQI